MIGRKKEIETLNRLYSSNKSEFIAIYGRRRVGKTYLISKVFKNRFTFKHTGISPIEINNVGALSAQLDAFYTSLNKAGLKERNKPKSWFEAFGLLEDLLDLIDEDEKILIFIDELPWLDTPRSGFISALESFWNGWASYKDNVKLIVCGSASSWILDNLIHNHGGLYNRLTYQMKLEPFTLNECEEYFVDNNVSMSRYDIAQSYMILGGIPYYLGYFEINLSLALNIDNLFFNKNAVLKDEFDKLFSSVFANPNEMISIVRLLSKRKTGYTRDEILNKLNYKSSGYLTKQLSSLIASDFIVKYTNFNKKKDYYKLIDPFCLFYLHFLDKDNIETNFWSNNLNSNKLNSWRGYAFENLVFNHVEQIKKALGVEGINSYVSSYYKKDEDGAQIDMLIVRNDNVVNLCEMKYYGDFFSVNKDYYMNLNHKLQCLISDLKRKQVVHPILITTYGLKQNEYSSFFNHVITLDDLFKM